MALSESAGGTGTWPTNAGAVTTGTITPASGDLLVAIAVCGNGDNTAATAIAMSGTGAMSGAWTLLAHLYLTTGPMAAVFCKDAGASPSSGTATATFSSPIEGSGLIVRRFAGAAPAASQTGVTVTAGSAGGGVYTAATGTGLTTGSRVVGGFADSSNSITLTANANSTIYNKANGSGGDTLAAFEASAASAAGTSVTLGFTNTGSDSTSIVLVEILPSAGATVALTAPNIALAAPLVTPGGGGAVALTAPNIALAAPLVTPGALKTVALTAPNLALAAPLLTPSAGATVALTAPNITLAAPLASPAGSVPVVAGTWTGSYAVTSGFFFPFPSARPVQVPVTNTAGDWLFAFISWRPSVAGSGVSAVVADDAHNWWEPVGPPVADSGAAGVVRTAIWAAPAARVANSVTGVTRVQAAATGPVLSLAVTIIDMSGLLPWYQVAMATAGNLANAATSLAVSAGAPSASAVLLAAFASDNNSDTITGPSGWTALTASSASNGVDHTADVKVTPAWKVSSSAPSASVSSSGSLDLAGVIAGVLVAAPQPAQPNPYWPAMVTEAAIGSGVQTPPSQMTWTPLSGRSLAMTIRQGKPYSLGALQAGQGTLTLDDPDGALIPPGTGPYAGIDSGTPLRRRVTWPGLPGGTPNPTPNYVAFSGFFRRWPWNMDPAMLRGQVQAETADVWAYGNGPLNSMAIEECLLDSPRSLWPLTDPAGSSDGSNLAAGNSLPLVQVASKFGAGGATATWGTGSGTLIGASSALVTRSGQPGGGTGMWQQALSGTSLAFNGYGYALQCTDTSYPPISGGVTVEAWAGCTLAATLAAIGGNGFCLVATAGGTFNTAQSNFPDGMPITLGILGGSSLPAPFTPGTYYVTGGDGQGNYSLSATQGGSAITTTSSGVGTVAPFIPWSPVFLQLCDGKGLVAGLSIRSSDGALLLPSRSGTSVVDSGHDYRGGLWHLSLALTQATWRVLVNGGSQALTAGSGTFSPALPATFREATFAGTQDAFQHGNALPGSIAFAGVYPGISPQVRVISRGSAAGTGLSAEAACDRVERLLEYAGLAGRRWLGQEAVTGEGDLTVSGQDIGGQAAVSSINNVTASTAPALTYIAPTGDTVYRSKLYAWNEPVRWVLGDNTAGGEIPFTPGGIATDYDPSRVTADVQVTQLDTQAVTVPAGVMSATTMTAVARAAGGQYGGQPYQVTGYLDFDYSSAYNAGSSLQDLANWVQAVYARPANRVQAVTVNAASHPAAWPFWAGASTGDMVQVNVRLPTASTSPLISLIARITQTDRASQFSQDGTSATITAALDFAPEYLALACDDPVRGKLDGSNVMPW